MLLVLHIVDFVCLKRKLVVKVDGSQHLDNQEIARTFYLNQRGCVIHFWNNQVLTELNSVLQKIYSTSHRDLNFL